MFVSNSNPPNDLDKAGEIYKMRLDGTVVGKVRPRRQAAQGVRRVSAIDCRTENHALRRRGQQLPGAEADDAVKVNPR
jgi:hypothetical protein